MKRTFLPRLTVAVALGLGLALGPASLSPSAPATGAHAVADAVPAGAPTSPNDMGWQ
ncbi:hypothetical protein [Streptacidiphilus jiangxiensis]|uniref:Uncharacterized protein n=1 Tax=Streptacidiphilus jiangxiensis TaxID=235985 RepID=A0A1H7Y540_STRJI|nr:hypothetical protein [Streptacidiphilus jiangxiensis]SEM40438.1 hypothetical protein SAMN05414137_12690 [Streptacidiphilus jiangxiensis]